MNTRGDVGRVAWHIGSTQHRSCGTVTYNKNIYLVFIPIPGTEHLKPLEFLK